MQTTLHLTSPVTHLYGIGAKQAEKLGHLGIATLQDLIWHLPRRYDDFSRTVRVRELRIGEKQTVRGVLWKLQENRSRRGLNLLQATLVDESGVVHLTWFNQPFLKKQLVEGSELYVSGKVDLYRGYPTFSNPSFLSSADSEHDTAKSLHVGRIVPVYAETAGITSKWLRGKVKAALDAVIGELSERLPVELLRRQKLLGLPEALREIHFPTDAQLLRKARERIGFEELFYWQLRALMHKRDWQQAGKAYPCRIETEALRTLKSQLPFSLTQAQSRAVREILEDIRKPYPMNRLLEGDVGSGKTIVAAIGAYNAVVQGLQAVIMTPTEILAEQHFTGLSKLFHGYAFEICLLTGTGARLSSGESISKLDCYSRLADGSISLLIGTHAVIQEGITFDKLAYVVIDEQHRFGVQQRGFLSKSSGNPDVLVMTATPIPRTLALALYGDLEVSIIDEMPKGRKPIITKQISPGKRQAMYGFLRQQLDDGHQAYVICPLVEESDVLEVKSATEEVERLRLHELKGYRLGLLHGRLKSRDKEAVLRAFRDQELDVLVSTSVVEVGVDVPNATIMLIEGAERFGLAQLHQFRGRVGRGEAQSYCFLLSEADNEEAQKRLDALVRSTDGFKLAEEDLKLRGPGEVFGRRQSGVPDLKMASLLDIRLIKRVREEAELWVDRLNDFPEISAAIRQLEHQDIVWN
ncbi:MAG TPA: ATP-dependent DNA helicase RecG [bacterium]|nr:ATP-dependent DNA helicase RecG [bacterium]